MIEVSTYKNVTLGIPLSMCQIAELEIGHQVDLVASNAGQLEVYIMGLRWRKEHLARLLAERDLPGSMCSAS